MQGHAVLWTVAYATLVIVPLCVRWVCYRRASGEAYLKFIAVVFFIVAHTTAPLLSRQQLVIDPLNSWKSISVGTHKICALRSYLSDSIALVKHSVRGGHQLIGAGSLKIAVAIFSF